MGAKHATLLRGTVEASVPVDQLVPGDLVVVRVDKRAPKIRRVRDREYIDGEVMRILRRAHRTVVGRFHLQPEPYVVPFDVRIDNDILIFQDATLDAREGEMVNVEIERYPDRFLFGTDEVAPADQQSYLRINDMYAPLWKRLRRETSAAVRTGNYERLFDAARQKVRAWEKAQGWQ